MSEQQFHHEVMAELEQQETQLPALYQLSAEYRAIQNKLIDLNLPADVIADTLESINGDMQVKSTNVAFVIRNLDGLAYQIKEAEKEMEMRRKSIENRAESIRNYLLNNMMSCGINKIESAYFSISIRKNPASVVIDNIDEIPSNLYQFYPPPEPVPDKKAIKDAIESGEEIKGAHLEHGYSLRIK